MMTRIDLRRMELKELNDSQRKAVTYNGKHLLVLAGAGTGKTKTIIARAAYLISEGVNPSQIQILTFTKRAASEIVSRVKSTLSENQANTLNGSTFHSWCNQLLTKFPNLFGTTSFTIIDQDDQVSIMKMVCGKNSIQFEDLRIKAQQLVDLYSFARNTKRNLTDTIRLKLFGSLTDEETNDKIGDIKPKLEVLFRGYESKKRQRKYLDYDDMLLVVATRLHKDEEARRIISSQYQHLLVDEMQDTNPLQWDLLSPFQSICHLFCVGDDAQSIYSFRGADFKNVHSFKERVPQSEVYLLEDNYRSTQEILDLSNWLISNSSFNYNKKLNAVRGDGKLPEIINIQNEWEEAYWIADNIIENYNNRNKNYSDHLVLSRSAFYTKNLQAIFIQKKIPYITYGGRKFMESAHIKDVISALRVVNNTDDEIAWIRFLTFWEGIGEVKAARYIRELLGFDSIEDCICYLETIVLETDGKIISEVIKGISTNLSDIQEALKKTYTLMEGRMAKKYRQDWDQKRKSDFPVLNVLADNYATLGEFITEATLDNSTRVNDSPWLKNSLLEQPKEKDHVIISTIHSAKGLESDICYVINVSPKAYPSIWSLGSVDDIEEERRVLYVALTRAKNELVLTRNIHSIRSSSITKGTSDQVTDHIGGDLIQEHYFLNGLPQDLAKQHLIQKTSLGVASDINEPNSLDLSIGMDFS